MVILIKSILFALGAGIIALLLMWWWYKSWTDHWH